MTKNKQEEIKLPLACLWWGMSFYKGKTQLMHSNIDAAERGQVPNASQLDPAQTQTDGLEKRGSTSPISNIIIKKHSKQRVQSELCEVGMQQLRTSPMILHR